MATINYNSGNINVSFFPTNVSSIWFCDKNTAGINIGTNGAAMAANTIQLGNVNTSTNISGTVNAGVLNSFALTTNLELGKTQTSGTLTLGDSISRTGPIYIGNNTAGIIGIGSAMTGSNYLVMGNVTNSSTQIRGKMVEIADNGGVVALGSTGSNVSVNGILTTNKVVSTGALKINETNNLETAINSATTVAQNLTLGTAGYTTQYIRGTTVNLCENGGNVNIANSVAGNVQIGYAASRTGNTDIATINSGGTVNIASYCTGTNNLVMGTMTNTSTYLRGGNIFMNDGSVSANTITMGTTGQSTVNVRGSVNLCDGGGTVNVASGGGNVTIGTTASTTNTLRGLTVNINELGSGNTVIGNSTGGGTSLNSAITTVNGSVKLGTVLTSSITNDMFVASDQTAGRLILADFTGRTGNVFIANKISAATGGVTDGGVYIANDARSVLSSVNIGTTSYTTTNLRGATVNVADTGGPVNVGNSGSTVTVNGALTVQNATFGNWKSFYLNNSATVKNYSCLSTQTGGVGLYNFALYQDENVTVLNHSTLLGFKINDQEKMRIGANGYVGIGNSFPNAALDIASLRPCIAIRKNTANATGDVSILGFNNGGGGSGPNETNSFPDDSSQYGTMFGARIKAVAVNYLGSQSDLYFQYKTTEGYVNLALGTDGSYTTAMVIKVGGNVGIGTTSPVYKLDVNGTARITSTSENQIGNWKFASNYMGTNTGATDFALYQDASETVLNTRGTSGFISFKKANNTTMVIDGSGRLGIGITNPGYKLDVNGDTRISGTLYTNGGTTVGGNLQFTGPYAAGGETPRLNFDVTNLGSVMFQAIGGGVGAENAQTRLRFYAAGREALIINAASGKVGINNYYSPGADLDVNGSIRVTGNYSTSDRRIKKNIVDVNDSSALDIVRLLKPKTYEYIDQEKRTDKIVYGYIAQEVKEVLHYAVLQNKEPIPNIFEKATATSTTLQFTIFDTSNLSRDKNGSLFKLVIKPISGVFEFANIVDIVDDHTVRIDRDLQSLSENDSLFVYGQEVDDLHTVNKEAIWTVSTAALQEVDRQLQAEKEKTVVLEQKCVSLETKCETLQSNYEALLARIMALETKGSAP